jgi:hypothetical protein
MRRERVKFSGATTTPLRLAEVRSWQGSAPEWLDGKRLPEVFERHFGTKARLTRAAAGEVGGPYIRFATQTMVELGLPCKPETIAKAVTAARTGRARSRYADCGHSLPSLQTRGKP